MIADRLNRLKLCRDLPTAKKRYWFNYLLIGEWYFMEQRFSAMDWTKNVRWVTDMSLFRLTLKGLQRDTMAMLLPFRYQVSGQKINEERFADVVTQMVFLHVRTEKNTCHKHGRQTGGSRRDYNRKACEFFVQYAWAELEFMGIEPHRTWVDAPQLVSER